MLVPSFGPHAQASLASLCVLVVGAGGLGCPVALYLAGAGVGRLVLVDDDIVTPSNLHRQVAFTEEDARAGRSKADALARSCTALNGLVRCEAVVGRFGPGTAAGLVDRADVIVDATDNPGTRYLLNDAAVLAGKPVVSGAALGADGQVSVYGWAASVGGDGEGRSAAPGPCYRCLFPTPPPATATGSCADSGVLGPITGIIGCLQALEVLKIAADLARTRLSSGAGRTSTTAPATGSSPTLGLPLAGTLLLLDGAESRFRSVRMRGRSPACAVCGDAPTIRSVEESARWLAENGVASVEGGPACAPAASVAADTVPYVNARAFREAVEGQCRGRSGEEAAVPTSPPSPLLLDVREPLQFEMAHLRGTRNIPLADMRAAVEGCAGDEGAAKEALLALVAARCGADELGGGRAVHVICRRGVDSVDAARLLRMVAGLDAYDVRGGLQAYADMQRRDGVEDGRRFPHY